MLRRFIGKEKLTDNRASRESKGGLDGDGKGTFLLHCLAIIQRVLDQHILCCNMSTQVRLRTRLICGEEAAYRENTNRVSGESVQDKKADRSYPMISGRRWQFTDVANR